MKVLFLTSSFLLILILLNISCNAQNKYSYLTTIIKVKVTFATFNSNGQLTQEGNDAFDNELSKFGAQGYRLVERGPVTTLTVTTGPTQQRGNYAQREMFLEKYDAIEPKELQRLKAENDAKIIEITSREIAAATARTKIDVLNILEKVPKNILASEYSEQLKIQILADLKKEMDALVQSLRSELNK